MKRLIIRMSCEDERVEVEVPMMVLDRARSPENVIRDHAELLYRKLNARIEARFGKGES